MKKILSFVFSMALCMSLASCNNNQAVNIDDNIEISSLPVLSTAPEMATDKTAEPDKPVENLDDMYKAYFTALENLIKNHILPDGIDGGEQLGEMAENKFAIYDVDNDGKEELLLLYTTTCSAGWAGFVLAYDEKTNVLQTELCEFVSLTFYDNGIIKAEWSHNQGRAGDFWPYSLYQYTPDSDSYVLVGMVDAWDKNCSETDNYNNPFPDDIDKSVTGFVYYIMEDGQYDNTHPIDASEYNEWVKTYIRDASEIQIQYMDLTNENISQIRTGL